MPEHLKQLHLAEETARAIADVKGDLLVHPQNPGHFAVLTHPLRMGFGVFDFYMTVHFGFGAEAVIGLDAEGNTKGHLDIIPAEETVHLCRIFSPSTGLYHQVGGLSSVLFTFLGLTVNRRITTATGIAEEIFDKECLFLPCFFMPCGKRMPPPIVAAITLTSIQLTRVACDFMFIEHSISSFRIVYFVVL